MLVGAVGERVAVLQHVNPRGGRRDAFVKDGLAGKRVDERALAGVELADHDEQEELVELPDRRGQRRLVLRAGAESRQRVAELAKQLPSIVQLSLELGGEYTLHQLSLRQETRPRKV